MDLICTHSYINNQKRKLAKALDICHFGELIDLVKNG